MRVVGNSGQNLRELPRIAAIGGAIEDPAALLEARKQARFAQQLQMPANARLALTDDLGELAHRQLRVKQQQQQAQPRGVAGRFEHVHQSVHRRLASQTYINISLYHYAMSGSVCCSARQIFVC